MKKLRPNIFLNLIPCAAYVAATALALSFEETFARREDCTCLPIAKCPPLLNLIKERKFDEMREHIRCGFERRERGTKRREPLLCCPIENPDKGGKSDMNTGKLTERNPYNVTELKETFEEGARSNITTGNLIEGVAEDMTGKANPVNIVNLTSIEGKNSSEPFNGKGFEVTSELSPEVHACSGREGATRIRRNSTTFRHAPWFWNFNPVSTRPP